MLHLLFALHCEARPWIEHYRLKRIQQKHAFECYQNDEVRLVISGIGALAMASATAWLGGRQQEAAVWLNIGCAGHADAPVGQLYVLNAVKDQASGQQLFPPALLRQSPPASACLSCNVEQHEYPVNSLVDMEAYAFQLTARRFQSAELVQCLKVVSDNREQAPSRDKAFISELMHTALPQSLQLIERWQSQWALLQEESVSGLQNELEQGCHFTQTQKQQLQRLLQQSRAYGIETTTIRALLQPELAAKPALKALQSLLQSQQQ